MTMHQIGSFPELLRAYRKAMGWTQEEMAKHWNYSFETISAWERGKRNPSNHEVPRLASLLNVGPEALAQRINISRSKAQEHRDEETESEEQRHKWMRAFDMWGEVQGIYRDRIEFSRDFSYTRLLENAHHVYAAGISLNDITINYSRDKIIQSIVENKVTYQLCFLDPYGTNCAIREQEEGFRPGFLSDLIRLNLQRIETIYNRISKLNPEHVKQLQVNTYELVPRFNIYIIDDMIMTMQSYTFTRGEETPLFVLRRQGLNGLFDFYASAAKYVLEHSIPVVYQELGADEKLGQKDQK